MTIERKTFVLEQAAVDSSGEGSGYGAVFGNKDLGGDVIVPGFFAPVLPEFRRTGFMSWAHDWTVPVAMPTKALEDQVGLDLGWKYHSTEDGQNARTITTERLDNEQTMGLSIGYEVDVEEQTDQTRMLIKAKRLFEVGFVLVPMNELAGVVESKDGGKQAIAPHSSATTDAQWDGNENERHLSNDAGGATYRRAFAWVDPSADPDTKSAYKFMHHMVSVDGTVGAANLFACSTGIGVLNGGRVGTTIPDADKQGVWNHLAKHLRDAERVPPELRGVLGSGLAYADHLDLVLVEAKRLVERTSERVDIRSKEGRVLSSENRSLIAEVAKLLTELLDRTTTEPPKSFRREIARLRLDRFLAENDIRTEEIH